MGQLCSEAEQEKAAEARVERRRRILRNIGRSFVWILMAAGLAAGIMYREDIGRVSAKITSPSKTEPSASVDRNAKVQKVLKDVKQYMEVAEDAGK